jgi:pimeloyl-ACP methyl ester carboxylesterase
MKRHALTLALCLPLAACGGGERQPEPTPQPAAQPAANQGADQEDQENPERPRSWIGETFHSARRDVQDALGIGNDKPPSQLIPKTKGHRAGDPVAIVVHGIMPVHAHLDAVIDYMSGRAQVYYFQYDDMQDLNATAQQLGEKVREVLEQYPTRSLTIVAHSMGGLVSRRACTVDHPSGLAALGIQLRLVTIASPFAGYTGADYARMDMGMGADSWQCMGATSKFVTQPGDLGPAVRHSKIETNETGKTRREGGETLGDDAASLDQQRQAVVDQQAASTQLLDKGHVAALITEQRTLPAETREALDQALR